MGWDTRITFYWRQYAAGNLGLLCKFCNGSKGNQGPEFYPAERIEARKTGGKLFKKIQRRMAS